MIKGRKSLITAALVALLSLMQLESASGAVRASGSSPANPVASATWSVVATPLGAAPQNGPLIMAWNVSGGTAYQYFELVNTGSLALSGETFRVINVYNKTGNVKPPTVTFDACIGGTFNTSTTACSGTIRNIGSTSTEVFTTLHNAIAAGGRFAIRASTPPGASSSYTTTVSVSVNRAMVRGGQIVNR